MAAPAKTLVYAPAKRGDIACLIMIAGPAGVGKTFSALRLARGLAGPHGKICFADTDNGRAALYADDFDFFRYDMQPPFRPAAFEKALADAKAEQAAVVIFDSFTAEHNGPGGVLEYHEEEMNRLTKGDLSKRDSLNMVGWIKPKGDHKRMLRGLYRQNLHIILCCEAERKVAMVKQTEGKDRGKVIPVDLGLQAVCGDGVPFAMTMAFMLEDVKAPGVPTPIKALLPALKPIVRLDRALDEETGARIAAWAHGDRQAAVKATAPAPASPAVTEPPPEQADAAVTPPVAAPAVKAPTVAAPPPSVPAAAPPVEPPRSASRNDIVLTELIEAFNAVQVRRDHLVIVDDPEKRKRIDWFKKNKPDLHARLYQAMQDSWHRTAALEPVS